MRPVEKNLGKLEWKLGIARQRFEGIKEDSSIKDSRFSGICTWIIAIHVAAALACSAAAAPNGSGHKSTGGSGSAPPTGTLVTIQNLNSGLCVDTGGSIGITALIQAPCSGATTQNFVLQSSPASGYDYLVSSASSLCWDVAGGSNAPGALIQQYTCTSSSAEYYKLSQVNSGVYKILSGNMSNGCVDIVGAATSSGAAIEQNTCNGSASQIFQVSASGTRVSISVSPTSGTISSGGTQQ
ncbi:MAG: hypothetical protein DMG21_20950, partial [Acidobacteria bacterium]